MDNFYTKREIEQIANNIQVLIAIKGWSPNDLAEKSGVSNATLSLFFHKKHIIKICTLGKIAKALDVSFDDLLKKPSKIKIK